MRVLLSIYYTGLVVWCLVLTCRTAAPPPRPGIFLLAGAGHDAFDEQMTLSANWITAPVFVESEHPYRPRSRQTWRLGAPDLRARNVRLHFRMLETERDADLVAITDLDGKTLARYSGAGHQFWSRALPARVIEVRLESDAGVQGGGFVVDRVAYTGCLRDSDCGVESGWSCQRAACDEQPCFNACAFAPPRCDGETACPDHMRCGAGGVCLPAEYCNAREECRANDMLTCANPNARHIFACVDHRCHAACDSERNAFFAREI